MTDSCDDAAEILQLLRGGLPAEQLRAALHVAVLGYGDLTDRSDPRQVAEDVLGAVRSTLVAEPSASGANHLRRVV
ncbi:hypothetical protein BH10ACT1_BH10ACT1_18980 [soil metagenome]